MVKSVYDYIGEQWKKPDTSFKSPQKNRLIQWRREENFLRVDKPLRVDRARSLGYKAKQGYIIVRARVRHGGLNRHQIKAFLRFDGKTNKFRPKVFPSEAKARQRRKLRVTGLLQ